MPDAEKKLWNRIRNKQLSVKFRRQQPIGKYIVDFVCFNRKLIIEIDGGQHFASEKDKARDQWFKNQGYTILRFWNNEVTRNIDGVVSEIIREISPSPLSPPIKGGGERGGNSPINRGEKGHGN